MGRPDAGIVVVIPTFKREPEARRQVERFLLMDCVAHVIVVDQGGTLDHDPEFSALVGDQEVVQLISQANLGGSGGYARGMLESLRYPECSVLLSDDDAVMPAEALGAMLRFQQAAARPTIVGSGMFSAEEPTVLTCLAEAVRRWDFMWVHADGLVQPTDTAGLAPDDWTFTKLRRSINYTGWWGTLLPPGTVAELGLPAPYFLKWDDAEYGLRATRAGYEHAILPEACVTHPTWGAHATQMTWTARVLHRNRLVTAAAYDAGRGVILSSFVHQMKHVLAGHDLTATLWAAGIDQLLAGPEDWLGRDLMRAREDGQRIVDNWERTATKTSDQWESTRSDPLPMVQACVRAFIRILSPSRRARVVLKLPAAELTWRATLGVDVTVATGEDGVPVRALETDGPRSRALIRRTLCQHWALARRWRELRRRYRAALPQVTTEAAWRRILCDDGPGRKVSE